MAKTYTTRQGETVDLACMRHYGQTRAVTEIVLNANPGVSLEPFLPIGTVLIMPKYDTRAEERTLVSLWD